ncbi:MAG TPA: hypothetical protein ENK72_00935 [Epsilonproteobacteria bacterium]|nr:hypothetical protein [Campylobacterota bacterium]
MASLLYLHGFASCGQGNKSTALKAYFGQGEVLAPDLPYAPEEAISFIEMLCKSHSISLLIGSSLGGFYATVVSERTGIPAVLLNPSVKPWQTLALYVGINRRFCDDVPFTFEFSYLEEMESVSVRPKNGKYLVLLQSDDEVLDFRIAAEHYKAHRVIVEYGGNHRFENITDYLSMIENFRNQ